MLVTSVFIPLAISSRDVLFEVLPDYVASFDGAVRLGMVNDSFYL